MNIEHSCLVSYICHGNKLKYIHRLTEWVVNQSLRFECAIKCTYVHVYKCIIHVCTVYVCICHI